MGLTRLVHHQNFALNVELCVVCDWSCPVVEPLSVEDEQAERRGDRPDRRTRETSKRETSATTTRKQREAGVCALYVVRYWPSKLNAWSNAGGERGQGKRGELNRWSASLRPSLASLVRPSRQRQRCPSLRQARQDALYTPVPLLPSYILGYKPRELAISSRAPLLSSPLSALLLNRAQTRAHTSSNHTTTKVLTA